MRAEHRVEVSALQSRCDELLAAGREADEALQVGASTVAESTKAAAVAVADRAVRIATLTRLVRGCIRRSRPESRLTPLPGRRVKTLCERSLLPAGRVSALRWRRWHARRVRRLGKRRWLWASERRRAGPATNPAGQPPAQAFRATHRHQPTTAHGRARRPNRHPAPLGAWVRNTRGGVLW